VIPKVKVKDVLGYRQMMALELASGELRMSPRTEGEGDKDVGPSNV
jgi:hypothetical protein